MIHICDNSKNYGIIFERTPTRAERKNTIRMVRRLIRKHEKSKGKLKKKKGKPYVDYTDNPNLSQALLSNNADDWIKAVNAEMKKMRAVKVYDAVLTIRYGKPWVPSYMILVRQRYADGSIKKCKARLVAGGHRQKFTSYEQTSSPTARPASIKIFFAMAAIEKKIIRSISKSTIPTYLLS